MYNVIEFEDSTLGIVRGSWLTPRKKECLWPPKIANKFNKCLLSQDSPNESWPIRAIKRVLIYETYSLQIAREKCKKAESESDLHSDTSEQCKKGRKRKPNNNIFHSDTEEEEDENYINFKYPNPPRPDELSTCKSKSIKEAKKTLPEVNVEPQKEFRADASPWDITSPKSPAANAEKLFVPESKTQFKNTITKIVLDDGCIININSCFNTKDRDILRVKTIKEIVNSNYFSLNCDCFLDKTDFHKIPIESSSLGIYKVNISSSKEVTVCSSTLNKKCFLLSNFCDTDDLVCIPFVDRNLCH